MSSSLEWHVFTYGLPKQEDWDRTHGQPHQDLLHHELYVNTEPCYRTSYLTHPHISRLIWRADASASCWTFTKNSMYCNNLPKNALILGGLNDFYLHLPDTLLTGFTLYQYRMCLQRLEHDSALIFRTLIISLSFCLITLLLFKEWAKLHHCCLLMQLKHRFKKSSAGVFKCCGKRLTSVVWERSANSSSYQKIKPRGNKQTLAKKKEIW